MGLSVWFHSTTLPPWHRLCLWSRSCDILSVFGRSHSQFTRFKRRRVASIRRRTPLFSCRAVSRSPQSLFCYWLCGTRLSVTWCILTTSRRQTICGRRRSHTATGNTPRALRVGTVKSRDQRQELTVQPIATLLNGDNNGSDRSRR